ncbi:MAG: siroheme synthase, partial [Acidobacteria bacterium]
MFPAFLDLSGRKVLVVGGGPVAAGKVESLLAAGARVTVVSPEVHPEIERADVDIVR